MWRRSNLHCACRRWTVSGRALFFCPDQSRAAKPPLLSQVDNAWLLMTPADIEVLEISKLLDGDAFRAGDDPVALTSYAEIDREAHRRAPLVGQHFHSFHDTDLASA